DIGGLHRRLLVGDDDELRPVGEAAQERDEAPDVRVVERRLDLVEQVEGARPREEEREQERDRAQRLLAAGQQRQARDALARRSELNLDAGAVLVLALLGQRETPFAAGEERRSHLREVALHCLERLGEAALDRLYQLAAQVLELVQAALEVLSLLRDVLQAGLLLLVLLARKGVDSAELLTAALQPPEPGRQLVCLALGLLPLRLRPAASVP